MFLKYSKCLTGNWFTVCYPRSLLNQANRYRLERKCARCFSISEYGDLFYTFESSSADWKRRRLIWKVDVLVPFLGGGCYRATTIGFADGEGKVVNVIPATSCPCPLLPPCILCRRWEHNAAWPSWSILQERRSTPAMTFKITVTIAEGAEPWRAAASGNGQNSLFSSAVFLF